VQDVESAAPELVIQAGVSGILCVEINDILGVTNPGGVPPEDDISAVTPFVGNFTPAGGDNIIGNDAPELAGAQAACRTASGGTYYYYHVLIGR